MKSIRFLIITAIIAVGSASLLIPVTASAGFPAANPAAAVTGVSKVCSNEGECVDFKLTFDPAGGPVTGSYTGAFTYHIQYAGLSEIVRTETETGELTGTFSGGDGGTIKGELTYKITNRVDTTNGVSTPQQDESGAFRPWKGVLRANGTGDGTIQCCQEYSPTGYMLENPWTVSFSAQDFQAGLSAAAPTTAPTITGSVPSVVPTSATGGVDPATQPTPGLRGLPHCCSMIILPFLFLLPKLIRR
jgi:hypothetical protein